MSKKIILASIIAALVALPFIVFDADLQSSKADPYGTRPAFEYEHDCDWFWNCY